LGGALAVGTTGVALGDHINTDNDSHLRNVLSIVGTTSTPTTYEVTVSDEIVPGRHADALSVLGTVGQSAEDAVGEGVRSYRFSGDITHLRLGEGATVFVNGARVTPGAFE
jgi:hypothetical protein